MPKNRDAHLYSRVYVCLDLFPPAKAKAIWTAAQYLIRQRTATARAIQLPTHRADTVAVWTIDRINRT